MIANISTVRSWVLRTSDWKGNDLIAHQAFLRFCDFRRRQEGNYFDRKGHTNSKNPGTIQSISHIQERLSVTMSWILLMRLLPFLQTDIFSFQHDLLEWLWTRSCNCVYSSTCNCVYYRENFKHLSWIDSSQYTGMSKLASVYCVSVLRGWFYSRLDPYLLIAYNIYISLCTVVKMKMCWEIFKIYVK